MEQIALTLGEQFRKRFLDLLLVRQAEALHRNLTEEHRLCPSCGQQTVTQDLEPRVLRCRAAVVEWMEPQRYCTRCRKAFFPQSKLLGIDTGHSSTALRDLIVIVADGARAIWRAWKSRFDTPANADHFGRSKGGRGDSAFPQLRKVSLVEVGTHVEVALIIGGYHDAEQTLVEKLWGRLPAEVCFWRIAAFSAPSTGKLWIREG